MRSEFYRVIDEKTLDQLAHHHGFCQRKRKLTPRIFLEMLLFKTYEGNQESLTDHVYELGYHRGINIKKQSLQDRFSGKAVAFVRDLVAHQLKSTTTFATKLPLRAFSKVFIQDATKFGLPDQLQEAYPSYGGRSCKAGGQIQFTYELKTQQIRHLELHPATRNEALASVNNSWIEKNALILRDLGYFTVKGFKEIIAKEAFFIARAKPKTSFYELNNQPIDLKKLLHKMHKHQMSYYEQTLVMGVEKKKKLPVRVVFCSVPEAVKQARLRKANYNGKQRNWTVTNAYKLWAGINVFITNVPATVMVAEAIPLTYKLRWQVELVFKTWKSHHKIQLYKKMKQERFECYLYASLLLILLQSCIYAWFHAAFSQRKIWLSLHKFSKAMRHFQALFRKAIMEGKNNLMALINRLLSLGIEALFKEKKKGKIGYDQTIIGLL